ncbi:hypothetical protein H072_8585 [Dactylellina haptotyla CBS 200.50]|uniref:Uncharacterized protein n=1 Tax=Dactylellina haptotyla (strain CBS 200.50) TaxID=1284197 RepID=S8A3X3_DACHA|nr:hypothetical protein H072_8585 [Dactylellina haptotyla CBS 200.50]
MRTEEAFEAILEDYIDGNPDTLFHDFDELNSPRKQRERNYYDNSPMDGLTLTNEPTILHSDIKTPPSYKSPQVHGFVGESTLVNSSGSNDVLKEIKEKLTAQRKMFEDQKLDPPISRHQFPHGSAGRFIDSFYTADEVKMGLLSEDEELRALTWFLKERQRECVKNPKYFSNLNNETRFWSYYLNSNYDTANPPSNQFEMTVITYGFWRNFNRFEIPDLPSSAPEPPREGCPPFPDALACLDKAFRTENHPLILYLGLDEDTLPLTIRYGKFDWDRNIRKNFERKWRLVLDGYSDRRIESIIETTEDKYSRTPNNMFKLGRLRHEHFTTINEFRNFEMERDRWYEARIAWRVHNKESGFELAFASGNPTPIDNAVRMHAWLWDDLALEIDSPRDPLYETQSANFPRITGSKRKFEDISKYDEEIAKDAENTAAKGDSNIGPEHKAKMRRTNSYVASLETRDFSLADEERRANPGNPTTFNLLLQEPEGPIHPKQDDEFDYYEPRWADFIKIS